MHDVLDTESNPRPAVHTAICTRCHGAAHWIECPTGGWWAHDTHPADDHDAEPAPR